MLTHSFVLDMKTVLANINHIILTFPISSTKVVWTNREKSVQLETSGLENLDPETVFGGLLSSIVLLPNSWGHVGGEDVQVKPRELRGLR